MPSPRMTTAPVGGQEYRPEWLNSLDPGCRRATLEIGEGKRFILLVLFVGVSGEAPKGSGLLLGDGVGGPRAREASRSVTTEGSIALSALAT